MKILGRIFIGFMLLTATPLLLFLLISMIGFMLYYRIAEDLSFRDQLDIYGVYWKEFGKVIYFGLVKFELYEPFTDQNEEES